MLLRAKDIRFPINPRFLRLPSPDKTKTLGKIFVLERDITGDNRINIDDLEWQYLDGDGDFCSKEICALRDEADIIVTNPPFSLFREFVAWLIEADKKFIIIGNMNAISYKEVFPLIKDNMIWLPKAVKIVIKLSSYLLFYMFIIFIVGLVPQR